MFDLLFSDEYHWLNNEMVGLLDQKALKKIELPDVFKEGMASSDVYTCQDYERIFHRCPEFVSARLKYCAGLWNKENLGWQKYLSEFFLYTPVKKTLKVCMTFFPIYPRDIKTKSFLIPLKATDNQTISVIAHEISHFYFYDAIWQHYFKPRKTQKDDLLNNKDVWIISEMLVPLLFAKYNKEKGTSFECSGYLFKKSCFVKYERDFDIACQDKNPFLSFFQKVYETGINYHELNRQYL